MSQREMILEHMETKGPITPKEALNLYGCMRLGARIYDLKRAGKNISRRMIEVPGKNDTTARVAEYRLIN